MLRRLCLHEKLGALPHAGEVASQNDWSWQQGSLYWWAVRRRPAQFERITAPAQRSQLDQPMKLSDYVCIAGNDRLDCVVQATHTSQGLTASCRQPTSPNGTTCTTAARLSVGANARECLRIQIKCVKHIWNISDYKTALNFLFNLFNHISIFI